MFKGKSISQLKAAAQQFLAVHPVGKEIKFLADMNKMKEAQILFEEFLGSQANAADITKFAGDNPKFIEKMQNFEKVYPEVACKILREMYLILVENDGIETNYCVLLMFQKLKKALGEDFPLQKLWALLASFEKHFADLEGYKYVPKKFFKMPTKLAMGKEYNHKNMWMISKPRKLQLIKGKWKNGFETLNKPCVSHKAINHAGGVSKFFLDTQNATVWHINWEWFLEFGIYEVKYPEKKPKHTVEQYEKIKEDARNQHRKKVFFLLVLYFCGIKVVYILNFQDFRGRVYPFQNEFNPQGSDWDKALLKFPAIKLKRGGKKALGISIANCFNNDPAGDLDKQVFKKRYHWFYRKCVPMFKLGYKEFKEQLKLLAEKAESKMSFIVQMLDAYKAWNAIWQGKDAYVSVITHWDSTASGYQIQSVIFGDLAMAKLTNLIDPNKRYDLYTELYNRLIAKGFPSKFTRGQVKSQGFVPFVYGGTNPMYELLLSAYGRTAKGIEKAKKYLQMFVDFMTETFVSCREARQIMELWDATKDSYSFTLPDGFLCRAKVMKECTKKIVRKKRTQAGDVYEIEYDLKWEEQSPIPRSAEWNPNIIHSIDAFILREIVLAMNYNVKWKNWIRHLMLGEVICEVNPNDPSVLRMAELLKQAERHQWYSMLILRTVTPHNIDMVPKKVLCELYNRLAKEPCQLALIHDSFGVHPNYAWEVNRQYYKNMELLKQSRIYQAIKEELLGLEEGSLLSFAADFEITGTHFVC